MVVKTCKFLQFETHALNSMVMPDFSQLRLSQERRLERAPSTAIRRVRSESGFLVIRTCSSFGRSYSRRNAEM